MSVFAKSSKRVRIVVLISGTGSNLKALITACASGAVAGEIVGVISNKANAFGLEHARRAGIATCVEAAARGTVRAEYDTRLAQCAAEFQPDLILLAGWMRILSGAFLDRFAGRVINLHPALPGAFPGTHAIARAYAAWQAGKIRYTGVMLHLVPDEGVDDGPVLAQAMVPITKKDNMESLEVRMHAAEHALLTSTLRELCAVGPQALHATLQAKLTKEPA